MSVEWLSGRLGNTYMELCGSIVLVCQTHLVAVCFHYSSHHSVKRSICTKTQMCHFFSGCNKDGIVSDTT